MEHSNSRTVGGEALAYLNLKNKVFPRSIVFLICFGKTVKRLKIIFTNNI
jgi:hypothetical protein